MLTTLDIRAELLRRGYTAARLARELGCHKSTVTRVINGEYPYQHILAELARIIGVPVGDLAPGRATPSESELISPPADDAMSDCDPDSAPRVAGASG